MELWPQPGYKLPPCKALSDFPFALVVYLLGAVGVSPCAALWAFSSIWRGYFCVSCACVCCTSRAWTPKGAVSVGKSAGRSVFQTQSFLGKCLVYDLETFLGKIYSLMREAGEQSRCRRAGRWSNPWAAEELGIWFLLCWLSLSQRSILSTKLSNHILSCSPEVCSMLYMD